MRRKDRELNNVGEILDIVSENKVLRVGMVDGDKPYVVPLNYGYKFEDGKLTFYVHSAKQGRKLDILGVNNNVCIEIDSRHELVTASEDCDFGYKFASVIGEGKFVVISDDAEKREALAQIMRHQTGVNREFDFGEMRGVLVCKLEIESFSGKACR